MGKLKVSFTTALFVFSFLICVIVAVVFVDRGPGNDYDSFYDGEEAGEAERDRDEDSGGNADEWAKRKNAREKAETAAPAAEEANLADLPLDPHLAGAAQPVPTVAANPAAAQPTANPHAGKSPEQIAREMMAKTGVPMPMATQAIPGMAVPGGIATPAQQATATPTPQSALSNTYRPVQSNVPGGTLNSATSPFPAPGGIGSLNNYANPGAAAAPPSLSSTTNSGSGWDALSSKPTPSSMIGVRGAGGTDAGMMISRGKTEADVEPPLGFEPSITNHGNVPAPGAPAGAGAGPGASQPGGAQAPLLFAPDSTPAAGNKWELPPAPTLRPPPIQDPDQRRSDADSPDAGPESPDSMSLESSSSQALAVSGPDAEAAVESVEPDAIAARVNEVELTEDQAVRLAKVAAKLKEETVTPDNRQEKMTEAVRDWTDVVAAAEEARKQEITLSTTEVDKYAAMRPDFDIEEWKKGMAEVGFTKTEIETQLKAIALSEKLLETQMEKKYPEAELKKVYEKTPKEFFSPRQVHVMEIFKAKPEDEKQAKRVAGEMSRLQRQASGGTDFSLLARQASEASSKSKGGDLGWKTPEDKADGDLAKAVSDLKPGQVSGVIESEDGYRIYKLIDEKEARDDFEGSRELVTEKLKKEMREKTLADARKAQEVELAPKKEIKVAKETAPAPDKKESEDKAAGSPKIKPKVETAGANTQTVAQKPIQQAAAAGQLLFAPGAEVEQRAGGAPAPAYQPGGQPPVQQSVSAAASKPEAGRGYAPGQTIVIGGDNAPSPTPANYAEPASVGTIATPNPNLTPEMQAAQLQALQAQAQQQEQQRNAQREAQLQALRAHAAGQGQAQEAPVGESLVNQMMQQQGNMTFIPAEELQERPVAPPAAIPMAQGAEPDRGITTESNGWQVTRRDSKPADGGNARGSQRGQQASAAAGPSTIPAGFPGGAPPQPVQMQGQVPEAQAQAQQQPQQQPQENTEERSGGLLGGVKSLFSRGR